MPDTSAIHSALVSLLQADATLHGYMPDGVYWNLARAGSTRFVLVSILDSLDESQFSGRSWESLLYLVKAVALKTDMNPPNMAAAAARIDALLDPQPPMPPATLIVPGYTLMLLEREAAIDYPEQDETNTAIVWFHRGGRYRVMMAPS